MSTRAELIMSLVEACDVVADEAQMAAFFLRTSKDRLVTALIEKWLRKSALWVVDEGGHIGILFLGKIHLGSYKWPDAFLLSWRGKNPPERLRPIEKYEANIEYRGT